MCEKMFVLAGGITALILAVLAAPSPTSAAPALLQLPWPAGHQHRIYGGNTYGCDTHSAPTASSSTAYNADQYAIDFQFGPTDGSPLDVSAVASGIVVFRGDAGDGYGNKVVLDHGGGYYSVYAHFRDGNTWGPGIVLWATAAQGQIVGYAGGTPNYTVHLHMHMQLGVAAYRPEPMSWTSRFGWYGFSAESGLGCGSYAHDPSPYWASRPPVTVVSGDYNCDGQTDIAVWRPGDGMWHVKDQFSVQWGLPTDMPVPGDYGGSCATDVAVWRPFAYGGWPDGMWHVKDQFSVQWGLPTDIPVRG